MKDGQPSREWSDTKKASATKRPDMASDAKRGGEHLREHHREESREIDRSYCAPTKDKH